MRPADLKAVVLTEGGGALGWGHLGRCSALAEALVEWGVVTNFVVNGDPALAARLPGGTADFFDWTADEARRAGVLDGADIAIVDSYLAPGSLYPRIAAAVSLGVWVDDGGRVDYPPGTLIDGSGEFLLRRAFWEVTPKEIKPKIKHILVTFGGGDPTGLTGPVIEQLVGRWPDLRITVIGGELPAGLAAAPRVEHRYGLDPAAMAAAMADSDLALTAAGQTLGEQARCGVPSLVFQTADNQRDNILLGQQAGFFDRPTTLDTLSGDLDRLETPQARATRSAAGRRMVRGDGARRAARRILRDYFGRALTARPVAEGDRRPLWELANDPTVRRNSFDSRPIPVADHDRWFDRVLTGGTMQIVIFEVGGMLVGPVRFEARDGEWVTSLSVAAPFRGLGLGRTLLRRALECVQIPDGMLITAYIKQDNGASRRTFEAAGYRPEGDRWVFRPLKSDAHERT